MLEIGPAKRDNYPAILNILKRLDLFYPTITLNGFWVAKDKRQVVAVARLEDIEKTYFISSVGVIEEARNKGIATTLLHEILKVHHDKDAYLYTTIPKFFERLGFQKCAPLPCLPPKSNFNCHLCEPYHCVCMRRVANR